MMDGRSTVFFRGKICRAVVVPAKRQFCSAIFVITLNENRMRTQILLAMADRLGEPGSLNWVASREWDHFDRR